MAAAAATNPQQQPFAAAPEKPSWDAGEYVRSRPDYPAAAFTIVREAYEAARAASPTLAAPGDAVAADIATGSGQFARGLARSFGTVIGIDALSSQVEAGKAAAPAPNISFRLGTAEATGLPDASVDILTTAEALHWFDIPAFYAEAARVLKPGGLIVIAGYRSSAIVNNAAADAAFQEVWGPILAPYWHPRVTIMEALYRGHEPPASLFDEVTRHDGVLRIHRRWSAEQTTAFARSWSGYAAYLDAHGIARGDAGDPTVELQMRMEAALAADGGKGDPPHADESAADGVGDGPLHMVWPMSLIVGRKRV
jgi:ubiquinone/menaquinone biosynthesis C-methylase UbiE